MVLPLFKSHYSLGRSILTLNAMKSSIEGGPRSAIDICLENEIERLFLVEDGMGGFLEAYINCKEAKMKFSFGLRITICEDRLTKNEDSIATSSKYIIFAKNTSGYKKLIKIYSDAAKEGFYYEPRTDFSILRDIWSDKELMLCVPFYDSFLYKNILYNHYCITDFSFTKPVFFLEDNDLFTDLVMRENISSFCKESYETTEVKSVFYENKQDFKTYLTFRCINNRTTLNKPQLDHMSSDEFCIESWKENKN